MNQGPLSLKDYFIQTGFYDLLPVATELASKLGFNENEMIEAVCKVYDKFSQYPPSRNRTAWFKMVFQEKLGEARGERLTFRATVKHK